LSARLWWPRIRWPDTAQPNRSRLSGAACAVTLSRHRAPSNPADRYRQRLRRLLADAVVYQRGPTAVRYPSGPAPQHIPAFGSLDSADLLTAPQPDTDVLLVAVGALAPAALEAAAILRGDGVRAAVVDPVWIAPVNPALSRAATEYRLVVTVEDNAAPGGFGDAFAR
jgi:1-deoxy-D-xylulose-5-phosphate synthase